MTGGVSQFLLAGQSSFVIPAGVCVCCESVIPNGGTLHPGLTLASACGLLKAALHSGWSKQMDVGGWWWLVVVGAGTECRSHGGVGWDI